MKEQCCKAINEYGLLYNLIFLGNCECLLKGHVVFLNAMVIFHTWDVFMCILQPDETYYMVSIFFSSLLLKKTETIKQN